jgi:phosphoribosyl 1,2-cyclic phosphodiesterase
MEIIAFDVPHDSSDNVGYFISINGHSFTFATDVGVVTNRLIDYCRVSDHIVIESNYDEQMLNESSYPEYLVRRIRGGKGHLSNRQTSEALRMIVNKRLKNVFLCHLSDNNNTPEVAFKTSAEALNSSGDDTKINLFCLPRRSHRCYDL